ncbi:MAG: serine protease [Roseovarius sp.]
MTNFRMLTAAALSLVVFAGGAAAQMEASLTDVARPVGSSDIMNHVFEKKKTARMITEPSTRVYGGRPAEQGAWPAQVSLHSRENTGEDPESRFRSQFCGGTLITRQWVLTAAHCVVNEEGLARKPEELLIRTGHVELWEGDFREVAAVIPHPEYDALQLINDIAVVKLAQPIQNSALPVGAIPVLEKDEPLEGRNATVVGWGLTQENEFPGVLMETDIDIVSNETCNKSFAEQVRFELREMLLLVGETIPLAKLEEAYAILSTSIEPHVTESMVCAGIPSGERDSCHGDSGGPLMIQREDGRWVQAGVVSWGGTLLLKKLNPGICGYPELFGVYTRVSHYYDWIGQTIRSN